MPSALTADQIWNLTGKYIFYSSIINLTVGVVGNVLMILIFITTRTFRANQCVFYLVAESIANVGLLLAYLPANIAGEILGESPAQLSIVWCKIQSMSCYVLGLFSLLTLCFLAFDQYLSTNLRQYWQQYSTLKLARRLTLSNACFAILHNLLFLIYSEIGQLGCTIYHPIARNYFKFFFYPILSGILPIILCGMFSLLAYSNVRRIIRRQMTVVRRRRDRQMTAIALARILCMMILGTPFLCTTVYELNLKKSEGSEKKLAAYALSSAMAYSLLCANYGVSDMIWLTGEE